MIKAIDDIVAFNKLGNYNPYRRVFGIYGNSEGKICINIWDEKSPMKFDELNTVEQTKIGDIEASWIEEVHPNYVDTTINGVVKSSIYDRPKGITKKHGLTWTDNGVRYYLISHKQSEFTMEEAIKIAESFMEAQK